MIAVLPVIKNEFMFPVAPDPGHFIYVHMPFCAQKCSYCDFFTVTDREHGSARASEWLETIAAELRLLIATGDIDRALPVRTIYFGGGTPSFAPPESVARFVRAVAQELTIRPDPEITLETQPDTVDDEKLAAFAAAGVTRFSVGVQTFNPRVFKMTDRLHTIEQSRRVLAAAARHGILSVDLISAWPDQTLQEWQADVEEALSFAPQHISVYELTMHSGTRMSAAIREGRLQAPSEELRIEMFEATARMLETAGYEQYEISNFARRSARSRHNENYWRLGDYIGLGAAAHSLHFPVRYFNAPAIDLYTEAIAAGRLFRERAETPAPDVFLLENLQMVLRLAEGVDLDWFAARMGEDLRVTRARKLGDLLASGQLRIAGPRLQLTPAGRLQLDGIMQYLIDPA